MSRPKPFKSVVISCRGPRSLQRQIEALARRAKRSRSDWMRLELIALVKQRLADARRDDAAA